MSQFVIPDSLKKQSAESQGQNQNEEKKTLFGSPPMGSSSFGGFLKPETRQQLHNPSSDSSSSNPFRSGFLLKGRNEKSDSRSNSSIAPSNPFAARLSAPSNTRPQFSTNPSSSYPSRFAPSQNQRHETQSSRPPGSNPFVSRSQNQEIQSNRPPASNPFATRSQNQETQPGRPPASNPFTSRLFSKVTQPATETTREPRVKWRDESNKIEDFDAPKRDYRADREAPPLVQRVRVNAMEQEMKPVGRQRSGSQSVASSMLTAAKRKSIIKGKSGGVGITKRRSSDEMKKPKKAVSATSAPFTYHTIPSQRTVFQQLRGLLGTNCPATYDRFVILKKRDELLSKARVKNTDVESARILHGACPDMCPERERYVRDVQKNLNPYECDERGNMIPEKTVKDYSRSAADQEEPLPHELRPASVLNETMNYLIGVIAYEEPPNSELARWYDFLWSRTRSIRKEITQQMIINETAVDLVEKCARLHIFVSFRLSNLDVGDFDQKMNTENLTKCLQSLRHLYDDLSKKGIYCRNEAEFRAYDIMLNLADTNVLSQVLTYRLEVRKSKPIQLALKLASALQNNNYVRFFRILKSDEISFLQACMCYRYFDNVRINALKTMIAFRTFPLAELIELLAFDEEMDVLNFANCLGIELDYRNPTDLNMARGKENIDVAGITPISKWVAEKKRGTLAEVLCNAPCPPVNLPPPANSFTSDGVYQNDPVLLAYLQQNQDEAENEQDPQLRKMVPISPPRPKPSFPAYAAAFASNAFTDLYQESVNGKIDEAGKKVYTEAVSKSLMEDLIKEQVDAQAEEVLFMARLEYKQKLAELEKERFKEMINKYINDEADAILGKVSKALCQKTAKKVFNHSIHSYHRQQSEQIAHAQAHSIIKEISLQQLKKIGLKVIQTDVIEVKQRLEQICGNLYRLWLKQFTDRWRKVVSHKKIKEERIRDIITSLSLANTAQNHFYDPNKPLKLPTSRRLPDEELTIKFAKIKLKQSKHQRLARKCFDLWYNATKQRVEQRKFLENFFQAQAATQEKEKSFIMKRKRNYMIPFKAPPVFGVPQTSAEMLQGTPRTEKELEPGSFATMSAKRPRLVAMLEKNRKRRSYLNSTEIREFQDVKKEIDEFQDTPVKSNNFFGDFQFSSGYQPSPILPKRLSLPDRFSVCDIVPDSPAKRISFSPTKASQDHVFKASVSSLEKKLEEFRLALKETEAMVEKNTQKCREVLNCTA